MIDGLERLKVEIPVYSFKKHQREAETTPLHPPRVLILEGILAFTDKRIVDMLDLKVYTYTTCYFLLCLLVSSSGIFNVICADFRGSRYGCLPRETK